LENRRVEQVLTGHLVPVGEGGGGDRAREGEGRIKENGEGGEFNYDLIYCKNFL
jgi:hypothetical protein